jgi:hypothetical protein
MVQSARSQGPARETRDDGLILKNSRFYYAKLPREGVSGTLDRTIPSGWPRLDLTAKRAGACACARRALTGGLGMSTTQGGANRSDLAAGARVRERVRNSRIWIGGLRLYLLRLNLNRQILDGRPRSNSQWPEMSTVAPLGLTARSHRRRGGQPRQGSRGSGKGSGAFRATRRTQPWASRWRGSTRGHRTRRKGPAAAQTSSGEKLCDVQDNKWRNRGVGRLLTTSANPRAPGGWRGGGEVLG